MLTTWLRFEFLFNQGKNVGTLTTDIRQQTIDNRPLHISSTLIDCSIPRWTMPVIQTVFINIISTLALIFRFFVLGF